MNFRQRSGKCSPNAPFSPDLPFLSNLTFSPIIEATGRLFNISTEFSPTLRRIFARFAFLPFRAFLDISRFLSYFVTLSNGPTLGIEPTAYCWFARDASAPNIGGQEEKCPSPLRTKKILLIANVTTL